MIKMIDQIGHEVILSSPPKRIISVVPSQTELLYDLDLNERVIGITKFCIHPKVWFESKQRVGGTKTLKLELIDELAPDLIIANKEENTQEQIEHLQQNHAVYTSDINCLEDRLTMIQDLGVLTASQAMANELCNDINQAFANIQPFLGERNKVLYLIWKSPHMSVGEDTFIHDMLLRCGLKNVLTSSTRYPEITPDTVKRINPHLVFLSSEPFPFSGKHIAEFEALFPKAKVQLVDGEYFSWYGSRLKGAPKYFVELLGKIQ